MECRSSLVTRHSPLVTRHSTTRHSTTRHSTTLHSPLATRHSPTRHVESEAVTQLGIDPISVREASEETERRALEDIDAGDEPPVLFELPYQARAQHPVVPVET